MAHMKALAELERRIGALYAELEPDDLLRTIPGIGQHLDTRESRKVFRVSI
jgi:hypothetical protein